MSVPDAVRSGEIAARQDFAVRLDRDCPDKKVRVRIERISQASGGIEPGNEIARLSANAAREIAARQNLPVRLYRDCRDKTVRVRVESHVERAVRVQSCNVVARLAAHGCEIAARQNTAVRLHCD